jgi:hypothetical protein
MQVSDLGFGSNIELVKEIQASYSNLEKLLCGGRYHTPEGNVGHLEQLELKRHEDAVAFGRCQWGIWELFSL